MIGFKRQHNTIRCKRFSAQSHKSKSQVDCALNRSIKLNKKLQN